MDKRKAQDERTHRHHERQRLDAVIANVATGRACALDLSLLLRRGVLTHQPPRKLVDRTRKDSL